MQSSMVVAGMDALSESRENILTRRANQGHYSIIAQFAKRPCPCPTGCSARLQAKNPSPQLKLHRLVKLHRLATAKGRLSRCRAARACHARARGDIDVNTVPDLDKATALVPGIANRYCSPSFETATEPVIGRAFARPVGDPPPAITAKPLRGDEV